MRNERGAQSGTRRESRARTRAIRATALVALALAVPFVAGAAPISHKEVQVPSIDGVAVENLQRWVNGGHDDWCKDAREVAATELRRVAPEFSGNRLDLVSLPVAKKSSTQAAFTWTSIDGSASYHVTVQRFAWLKPVAGRVSNEVWVPTRIEITRTEAKVAPKRDFREVPKA